MVTRDPHTTDEKMDGRKWNEIKKKKENGRYRKSVKKMKKKYEIMKMGRWC